MISSAVQDGLYVRAIGTDGSTLYTRKGELLGFTSVSVTVRDGNTIIYADQTEEPNQPEVIKEEEPLMMIYWKRKRTDQALNGRKEYLFVIYFLDG